MTSDAPNQPRSDDLQAIEKALEAHREIRRALANAWNPFFARFGTLRPVQIEAIPIILTGADVLITAPTAGGKTEAVFAPLAERIRGQSWPGLSVLLVTPTRALVNDLYCRLEQPFGEMRIALGRKTGDHPLPSDVSCKVLVTTPESTESLLTFRREVLRDVRAVVMDEIHLLDGTPRGDQLRLVLARLRKYLAFARKDSCGDVQGIAMSATVGQPELLAQRYLGESATIVRIPGQRDIEARVEVAGDGWHAGNVWRHFPDAQKVLVFVNSRKLVDVAVDLFRKDGPGHSVFGHHGSLSKSERESVEERFRCDRAAICVATMTLEVGIDIGDVDLVVCLDPPFSLCSFLQRIGRGCRRLQGRTRVLCVARDNTDQMIFQALVRQAKCGIPAGPSAPFRRSVLVQQILAYLRQVDRHYRTVEQISAVMTSERMPAIQQDCLDSVLADMNRQGMVAEHSGAYCPASLGWEFIESHRIFSNIQPSGQEVAVVDVDTGLEVARIAGVTSQFVLIAGRSYEVLSRSFGTIKVRRVAVGGVSPRYGSRCLPYGGDVGPCLREFLDGDAHVLEIVPDGNQVVVMTWVGRLLNCALAMEMETQGLRCVGSAFALATEGLREDEAFGAVIAAAHRIIMANPLGDLNVEQLVDCGPYFENLSPEVRKAARRDWLDVAFVKQWAKGLKSWKAVDQASQRAHVLMSLACL